MARLVRLGITALFLAWAFLSREGAFSGFVLDFEASFWLVCGVLSVEVDALALFEFVCFFALALNSAAFFGIFLPLLCCFVECAEDFSAFWERLSSIFLSVFSVSCECFDGAVSGAVDMGVEASCALATVPDRVVSFSWGVEGVVAWACSVSSSSLEVVSPFNSLLSLVDSGEDTGVDGVCGVSLTSGLSLLGVSSFDGGPGFGDGALGAEGAVVGCSVFDVPGAGVAAISS